jgi:threonylcarbamoyladenosine tRNA methylthiotransferase MtaB
MRTFSIDTLGCKVNQYESQQIRQFLESNGLTRVETENKPQLHIINTCCVTHTASAKSRQCINKAQKANSDAVFVICGCLPSANIDEISRLHKDSLYIIQNRNNLVSTLTQLLAEKGIEIKDKSPILTELPQLSAFRGQTRAFLKVQDGCDGCCSYCIVPKARPQIYSKHLDQVIEEAQSLVNNGHKEIVVTGIFLGAFGQATVKRKRWPNAKNDKLCELLERLAKVANLKRIRLSSLEPGDITERLLDTFCKNPNIMPHLHLSIQSGSDDVLKRMCRQYKVEDVYRAAELLRSRLDRPAITCDLIVGFPGETDDDFGKTVELAENIKFSKMHVFSFSPRKGTAAFSMRPKVDNRVVKERSQILHYLDKQLGFQFREQFLGQQQFILTETGPEGCKSAVSGRSERYFMVRLDSLKVPVQENKIVKVKLTKNSTDGLSGQLIEVL